VILYWRDQLECITTILNNPLFHGLIDFVPYKEYLLPTMRQRYLEWITGNDTWNMQVRHICFMGFWDVNNVYLVSAPKGCNALGNYSLIRQDQHSIYDW